eukprot:TRINITY_DN11609_c0_g1_i1.p1 TRINITY_DN11609_c0_g1~~TRINITY_DN11609_c0_g1_i1.p1  ORF type:complete len:195 (-),score=18.80 TRINITY_DN11609_c0_g1_i1:38-622(-)
MNSYRTDPTFGSFALNTNPGARQKNLKIQKCTVCGTDGMFRCSNCKNAIYCSELCQKHHWEDSHRLLCHKESTHLKTYPDGTVLIEANEHESTFRSREGIIFKVPFSLSEELFSFLTVTFPVLVDEGVNKARKPWSSEVDLLAFSKVLMASRRFFTKYSDEVFDFSILPYLVSAFENQTHKTSPSEKLRPILPA